MHDRQRTGSAPERAQAVRAPAAPAAPPRTAAEQLLALQRSVGNRAAAAELQRWPSWWPFGKKKAKPAEEAAPVKEATPVQEAKAVEPAKPAKTYPATVEIGAEKVVVNSEQEEKEAARIIKELPEKYGIDVSSARSMKILKDEAKGASEEWLSKVKTWPWLFKELRAIEKAIKHYAPVLGSNRASSSRKDVAQEVISVGKAEAPLRYDSAKKEWFFKTSVLGTYYGNSAEQRAFTMYKHGETSTPDYSDIDKQMEATATHEMAHGIFKESYGAWVKEFGYWLDANTKSGKKGAEAPPTDYGTTNAREDLAESVMFYFVDPERLKKGNGAKAGAPGNPCPLRHDFIAKLVGDWKAPAAAAAAVVPAAAAGAAAGAAK